jgi:sulfatase maturation enzyme AslB (radical SAM superfamily)
MSHDIVPLDKASKTKSSAAMRGIDYFKSLGKIRDVAIVVTLTKKNYMYLTSTVEEMSMNGIWTFFDMIHADRGQPGTKCKGYDKELMFEDREDFDGLRRMLDDLVEMKEQGYMCHASYKFIAMLVRMDFHLLKNYSWNCAREDEFPSWVTVDCDGVVYPCDDFQPMFPSVMIMDLKENWDAFGRFWKEGVDDRCPGCCWNTHIDAHLIKRGELKIGEYVHGKI